MSPTAAAVKKAKYRAKIICGKPKNKPRTKANFISPPPIPSFPRITLNPKAIIKKNRKADMLQAKLINNDEGLKIARYTMITIINGNKILLRIMPYFKSIKKITINPETRIK
jgi:hypothetical protein